MKRKEKARNPAPHPCLSHEPHKTIKVCEQRMETIYASDCNEMGTPNSAGKMKSNILNLLPDSTSLRGKKQGLLRR
jgi:hypothetical protein